MPPLGEQSEGVMQHTEPKPEEPNETSTSLVQPSWKNAGSSKPGVVVEGRAEPPYSWKLKELRKQYRAAQPEQRARIAEAGRAIRQAQVQWPAHAVEHVQRVLEAVRGLG